MYTVMLFALAGFNSSMGNTETPSWLTNYALARQQGANEKKPVAVIVGSGKDGWQKIVPSGALDKQQNQLLAGGYVCVYLDVATAEGKRMAQALEINGRGLVISDHSGKLMALHHQGAVASADLTRYLGKYADSNRVAQTTDQNAVARTSYYQAPAPVAPAPAYQPAYNYNFAPASRPTANC